MKNTQIKLCSWKQIDKSIRDLATDQVILIIDQIIWQLYQDNLKELLRLQGKQVILWKAPDGEKVKNFKEYETCMEFLIEKGVHRGAHIVAIGGGAVSDFAGFVAATVLRGISWSIIPTSLLAMIDASIGGKVAINSSFGKNLIGAFHLPSQVLIDLNFLETLNKNEFQSGKGELVKYCFLNQEIYVQTLKEGCSANVIEGCARYKQKVTEEDFKEGGVRKILNLGHTFGHGIERIYNIPHGEAVIWGSVIIFLLFERTDHLKDLVALINSLGLDVNTPPWYQKSFPLEDLMDFVRRDKKKQSNISIDLVLVENIGTPVIKKFLLKDIEEKFKGKLHELRNFSIKSFE